MTDDFDARLRRDLRSTALPTAPAHLRDRARDIAASGRPVPRIDGRRRARLVLAIAAVLVVGALAALALGSGKPPVTTVDGLRVMTVSEAIAAHASGQLPGGRAAIRGWWSNGSVGHSCTAPTDPVGELELRCVDGEYGITEQQEPMWVLNLETSEVSYTAQGPHLTPYVTEGIDGIDQLFRLPMINGQWFPPVPIVVVGHFDDPRAAQCGPAKRQLCLDRLVLDRIVEFDITSVATPGVTPTPTPFPVPAPSGAFEAAQCAGNVPYSFVGWTTTSELHIQFERPGHVFAMVTEDVVRLTEDEWVDDPNDSGHQFQLWGRKVCLSQDGDSMEFSWVDGSTYVLWDDGLRVPGSDLVRPPSASQAGPPAS